MPAGGWEWGCVRIEISGRSRPSPGFAARTGPGDEPRADCRRPSGSADRRCRRVARRYRVAHYGRDTYGSRGTRSGGSALVCASTKSSPRRRYRGAPASVTADRVVFADGRFSAPGVDRWLSWVELAGGRSSRRTFPPALSGLEASAIRAKTSPIRSARTSLRSTWTAKPARSRSTNMSLSTIAGPRSSAADRGTGARRDRAFARAGALRAYRSTTERPALDGRVHGLRDTQGRRYPIHHGQYPSPSPVNPLGVKGVGRPGRWRDPGDRQCCHRCPPTARCAPSRSSADAQRVWRAIQQHSCRGVGEAHVSGILRVLPTRPSTRRSLLVQHGDQAKLLAGGHSLIPAMAPRAQTRGLRRHRPCRRPQLHS